MWLTLYQQERQHLARVAHWFDGFSECWFTDRASFERNLADPAWHRVDEDASTLFHLEEIWGGMSGVVQERVITP